MNSFFFFCFLFVLFVSSSKQTKKKIWLNRHIKWPSPSLLSSPSRRHRPKRPNILRVQYSIDRYEHRIDTMGLYIKSACICLWIYVWLRVPFMDEQTKNNSYYTHIDWIKINDGMDRLQNYLYQASERKKKLIRPLYNLNNKYCTLCALNMCVSVRAC